MALMSRWGCGGPAAPQGVPAGARLTAVAGQMVTAAEAQELEPLARTHEVALWSPTTASAGAWALWAGREVSGPGRGVP